MWYVTNQRFLETPDGDRAKFTTSQNYVEGMITMYQGGVRIEPESILELPPNQVYFRQRDHFTWTIDVAADTLLSADHGLVADDRITVWSTAELPNGLAKGGEYYVVYVDEHRFQVATTAGGSVVPFDELTGTGTFYWAQPDPPLYESGGLVYDAYIELGAAPTDIIADGLWDQDQFIELFNLTKEQFGFSTEESFSNRMGYALHAASVLLRSYLRVNNALDMYTDAKSLTPTDVERTEVFRYVEMLLTFKSVLEEPGVIGRGPVAEHIEKFTSAVQITKRYAAYGSNKNTSVLKITATEILDMFVGPYLYTEEAGLGLTTMPMMTGGSMPTDDRIMEEKVYDTYLW